MFSIKNNGEIYLNRGDCFKAPLFINMGTDEEPVRVDLIKFPYLEVYMGIMYPNQSFENAIIRKKFTEKDINQYGDVVVSIEPEDTINLYPGKYYYEIKARIYNDKDGEFVRTIINKNTFMIMM